MTKKALVVLTTLSFVLIAFATTPAEEASKACPWQISKVGFGKWGNGNQKAGTWYKGSFPINIPGVTERPDWYVNGTSVGKSQIQTGMRFIPYSSSRFLSEKDNTVKVQFQRPPYNGAYHQCTINGFDWDHVPNGGYKWYPCH